MDSSVIDRRRKLTWEQRLTIRNRYVNRDRTGETSMKIAEDFEIARQTVPVVARGVEKVLARGTDLHTGSAPNSGTQSQSTPPSERAA